MSTAAKWTWYPRIDLAALTACAAVTAGAYFLAVCPLVERHEWAANRRTTTAEERHKADELAAAVRSARRELNDARTETAATPVTLKASSLRNQRTADLAAFCGSAGLVVRDIQSLPEAAAGRFASVPIILSASGSYPACARLLRDLHTKFADTGVESFELSTGQDDRAGAKTLTARLVWYVTADRPNGKQGAR